MESDLSAKHAELEPKRRKARKRGLFSISLLYPGLIFFLVGLYLLTPVFFRDVPLAVVLIPLGLGFVVIGALILKVTPTVSGEDRLFLGVYGVMSKLNSYIQDTSRLDDKKEAFKRMQRVADRVENRWALDFKLAEQVLAPVAELKRHLRDNVLNTIQADNLENIRFAMQHLGRFARYLMSEKPSVDNLVEVNRFLGSLPKKELKPNPWRKLANNRLLRSGFPLALGLVSGPIIFALASIFGIPEGLPAGVAASVGFPTLWFYAKRSVHRSE